MAKEIETDKWRMISECPFDKDWKESYIKMVFRLKSDMGGVREIKKEDLAELEGDLKNLEKWRIFRNLKKDLENE